MFCPLAFLADGGRRFFFYEFNAGVNVKCTRSHHFYLPIPTRQVVSGLGSFICVLLLLGSSGFFIPPLTGKGQARAARRRHGGLHGALGTQAGGTDTGPAGCVRGGRHASNCLGQSPESIWGYSYLPLPFPFRCVTTLGAWMRTHSFSLHANAKLGQKIANVAQEF